MLRNPKVKESLTSRLEQQECCKLQGHENNLIQFICACHECPYRYQKACAHCVIKLHGKHVEDMKEIEEFDQIINENSRKAKNLMKESEELIMKLKNPFQNFFEQLKLQLNEMIDSIQQRYLIQNQERAQQLIRNELDFINQFNQNVNTKQNRYLNDHTLKQYSNSIKTAQEKLNNALSLFELKQLLESNLILLLEDFGKNTGISYISNTSRNTSQRHSSCHNIMTPRSALNVFNHNISVVRSKKIRN
ncbi:unnamed protein product [Paramecium primaurelia]|uniref:Uncharacterized protein n=1 Tax=Paramecium primaurelia TaxID=5886 RepID=A0A8S1PL18_PARPR|nr:unnamed protein product [Paramecium primaurelia]